MNLEQAKEILSLYRPATADVEDPAFAEALELCEREPELKQWFQDHCEVYAALRAKLKQPVPEGFKEQILAERKVHTQPFWRRPVVLAAAAAVAGLMAILFPLLKRGETAGPRAYCDRMVSTALRGYAMELATGDSAQIRAYLAQRRAPADYVLPAPLQTAVSTGCAITSWQGTKVSMICFRSGKPLARGQDTDLWLFVTDRAALPGAPPAHSPALAKVNRAMTALWTEGDKTYLLVADGDREFIRKFL
jgi:hypothetical protein